MSADRVQSVHLTRVIQRGNLKPKTTAEERQRNLDEYLESL